MLLIDGNNIAMREAHARAGLSHDGMPTGAIMGFLQQVRRLTREYPGEVCFCWDSHPEASLRKQFWPGYKANRVRSVLQVPRAVVDARMQIHLLRTDILPRIGYSNQFIQEGYEADDLVAALAKLDIDIVSRTIPMPHVIVSSDKDLWQCMGPNVMMSIPGRGGYTHRDFEREYGLPVRQWCRAKAIAGDPSDGIDGIAGVGIKTAIKYLNALASAKIEHKIDSQWDLVERNARLVTLPWPGCNPGPVRPSAFDPGAFRDVCREYGLRSLL